MSPGEGRHWWDWSKKQGRKGNWITYRRAHGCFFLFPKNCLLSFHLLKLGMKSRLDGSDRTFKRRMNINSRDNIKYVKVTEKRPLRHGYSMSWLGEKSWLTPVARGWGHSLPLSLRRRERAKNIISPVFSLDLLTTRQRLLKSLMWFLMKVGFWLLHLKRLELYSCFIKTGAPVSWLHFVSLFTRRLPLFCACLFAKQVFFLSL